MSVLFTPIKIGTMKLKNRIVMAPVETNFATPEGEVIDPLLAYYEERAKGGVGLIIIEGAYIHSSGRARLNQLGVYDDKLIPGLKNLAEIIHAHDARVVLQVAHAGRQTRLAFSGSQPVAPSPIPCKCPICHEMPKELTITEVKNFIDAYVQGARRAKEAGFDGVEIHGAHGYLICEFASPYTNKRTDAYGGDEERRMRFPLEVLSKIREKLGKDFPLLYRISATEFTNGGLTVDHTQALARRLEEAGINALDVSAGIYDSGMIAPYMHTPHGHLIHYAKAIKEVVGVPVIAVGGITDSQLAEEIVRSGSADLVAAGRAFLADPHWPNKVSQGKLDEVRKCIRCNECLARLFLQLDVVCLVNAMLGREKEYQIKPATKPKKVLVIGGGVAGMEAARVATLKGHKVTLCERDSELGGQALLAAKVSHKKDFKEVTEHLKHQLEKLGVDVKLDYNVGLDEVKKIGPDIVILATGATPFIPRIPGANRKNVVTAFDVLAGKVEVGRRVLVVGGGLVGVETSLYLVEKGKKVTIVDMLDEVASDASPDAKNFLQSEVHKRGIQVLVNVKVKAINEWGITSEKLRRTLMTKLGIEETIGDVDHVVFAVGSTPERGLLDTLRSNGYPVHTVGDCEQPRKALEAIHEGFQVALQL